MRELTKTFNRFSWALSLFGAQQALNFLQRPLPGPDHPATAGLGSVARAAQEQLGGVLQQTFEAGDQVQRSAVDLAFSLVTLEALDPNRLVTLGSDLVRRSTGALWSLLPGGGTGAGNAPATGGQPCGWGPMPPAR